MTSRPGYVVDTNCLVSRLLNETSIPAQAVEKAMNQGVLLISEQTLGECLDVLSRPKLQAYLDPDDLEAFTQTLGAVAEVIEIHRAIKACRDPDDDKFLEVAVNGEAEALITGDRDLLDLNPFLGVAILSPRQFLDK